MVFFLRSAINARINGGELRDTSYFLPIGSAGLLIDELVLLLDGPLAENGHATVLERGSVIATRS